MELRPGVHLGPYRVVRLLGKGGMGAVYEAQDLRLGRPVAIKLLQGLFDDEARRRMAREARAAAAAQGPHVVRLHDVTELGGAMALVAVPLDRLLGLVLVIELGLFSGAFELIQVLRDRSEDAAAGTRTTAVVLGERGTLWLLRGTILLAAGFATLVLHRFLGPLLLLAALLPYRAGEARSHWNRLRLVFGLVWLGIVVTTVLDTRTHGLWLQIAQSAAL